MKDLRVPDISRILAIDYGSKRIGLALSDPFLLFSYPYKTLNNDQKIFDSLKAIILEMNVSKIILGMPYQDNGELSKNAGEITKFKDVLFANFGLEIIYWDERYTSEMAKQIIIQTISKKSKRRDKGLVDSGAASIILQEYLDSIKYKKGAD